MTTFNRIIFTRPLESTPLQLEVSKDGGETWQPYSFTQEYKMSGIDEKNGWSIPHWPANFDINYDEEKIHYCTHKWVDTGMRKTFCKECNVEGDYDPMTGKITIVFKEKTK